jgi:hypothetical protein
MAVILSVRALLSDRCRRLCVKTETQGLYRIIRDKLERFYMANSLNSNALKEPFQD